jgi:hypothetical protein
MGSDTTRRVAASLPTGPMPSTSLASILGQLALALKMAAISASDISSGCFLVCSLRSIHNPASLACAVVAATIAVGWLSSFAISYALCKLRSELLDHTDDHEGRDPQ